MITQELDTKPTAELNKAMYDTQMALTQPTKNRKAHYGRYADLKTIDNAIRIAIKQANSGISYSQGVIDDTNALGKLVHKIYTVIRHTSGEEKIIYGSTFPDDSNMQKQGANETYAKRTSLSLAFGIVVDDDDDGQGASLLDKYQREQERQRLQIVAWLKGKLPLINKDRTDQVLAVIGSKKLLTPDSLTYQQAFVLCGAVRLELSTELSDIGGNKDD